MLMSNWKVLLIEDATNKDICEPFEKILKRVGSVDRAIESYVKHPNWCLENNCPNLKMLREYYSEFQGKGIYVDHIFNGETLNEFQCYIFHNCKGTIKVGLNRDLKIVPMLYFANKCDMVIEGIEFNSIANSTIPIHIFGSNNVTLHDCKGIHINNMII